MSNAELRRRLKAVDPNLKIVSPRRNPKVLSRKEEIWLNAGAMIPYWPEDRILATEARYSLKQLKAMAEEHGVDPRGDKEALIIKLAMADALEIEGGENETEEAGEAVLPQTGPLYSSSTRKFKDDLEKLRRADINSFFKLKLELRKEIKDREQKKGSRILPEFSLQELKEILAFADRLYS